MTNLRGREPRNHRIEIRMNQTELETLEAYASDQSFVAPRKLTLSSAEKTEIAKDPAVQMVLEMFEGELHEMIRKTPPAAAPTGDQDTE